VPGVLASATSAESGSCTERVGAPLFFDIMTYALTTAAPANETSSSVQSAKGGRVLLLDLLEVLTFDLAMGASAFGTGNGRTG